MNETLSGLLGAAAILLLQQHITFFHRGKSTMKTEDIQPVLDAIATLGTAVQSGLDNISATVTAGNQKLSDDAGSIVSELQSISSVLNTSNGDPSVVSNAVSAINSLADQLQTRISATTDSITQSYSDQAESLQSALDAVSSAAATTPAAPAAPATPVVDPAPADPIVDTPGVPSTDPAVSGTPPDTSSDIVLPPA